MKRRRRRLCILEKCSMQGAARTADGCHVAIVTSVITTSSSSSATEFVLTTMESKKKVDLSPQRKMSGICNRLAAGT